MKGEIQMGLLLLGIIVYVFTKAVLDGFFDNFK
nr:MAG TPA: protein of unknown function DUF3899 [Caudoviricetes sp.]